MADIYVSKGFSREDALEILNKMVKNKQFFLEHMMVEEIGVMPVDLTAQPAKKGAVTFGSFLLFGSVPLVVYISLYSTLSKTRCLRLRQARSARLCFHLAVLKVNCCKVLGRKWRRAEFKHLDLAV